MLRAADNLNRERQLRIAAEAFSAAALFGSAVSVRDRARGEPLGIRLPLSVPVALLLGWGAGLAAPWPMPVAALIAARRYRISGRSRAGLVCAVLGGACIAGTLVEPVTRRPSTWTRAIGVAILANIATSVGMIAAGLRSVHHGPSQ